MTSFQTFNAINQGWFSEKLFLRNSWLQSKPIIHSRDIIEKSCLITKTLFHIWIMSILWFFRKVFKFHHHHQAEVDSTIFLEKLNRFQDQGYRRCFLFHNDNLWSWKRCKQRVFIIISRGFPWFFDELVDKLGGVLLISVDLDFWSNEFFYCVFQKLLIWVFFVDIKN